MSHRVRAETFVGCFSTLLILPVWHLARSLGCDESTAAYATGCALILVGLGALWLRRGAWAQRTSFEIEAFAETFRVSNYLRDFALYAFAEAALGMTLWTALAAELR